MKKVLVVEDNKNICAILNKRLENNGFSVDIVEDGYSFLGYLRNAQEPDIVILDLMLPERSGADLLYSLKCKWLKTKVFIFSAHPEYKGKQYIEDYISGFFCKSEGIDKLIRAIKNS